LLEKLDESKAIQFLIIRRFIHDFFIGIKNHSKSSRTPQFLCLTGFIVIFNKVVSEEETKITVIIF
jgi:hypothetical protein